jgi:hypothetical protein
LIRIILTAMLVLLSGSALAEELPLNPDVTKATLATTICQTGWTRTVRPYVSTIKQIKAEMLAAAGEPIERRNQYELDHRIPLALGGAVIDCRNLVLQPIEEARESNPQAVPPPGHRYRNEIPPGSLMLGSDPLALTVAELLEPGESELSASCGSCGKTWRLPIGFLPPATTIRTIGELIICPVCGGWEVVASDESQTGGSLLH